MRFPLDKKCKLAYLPAIFGIPGVEVCNDEEDKNANKACVSQSANNANISPLPLLLPSVPAGKTKTISLSLTFLTISHWLYQ